MKCVAVAVECLEFEILPSIHQAEHTHTRARAHEKHGIWSVCHTETFHGIKRVKSNNHYTFCGMHTHTHTLRAETKKSDEVRWRNWLQCLLIQKVRVQGVSYFGSFKFSPKMLDKKKFDLKIQMDESGRQRFLLEIAKICGFSFFYSQISQSYM